MKSFVNRRDCRRSIGKPWPSRSWRALHTCAEASRARAGRCRPMHSRKSCSRCAAIRTCGADTRTFRYRSRARAEIAAAFDQLENFRSVSSIVRASCHLFTMSKPCSYCSHCSFRPSIVARICPTIEAESSVKEATRLASQASVSLSLCPMFWLAPVTNAVFPRSGKAITLGPPVRAHPCPCILQGSGESG